MQTASHASTLRPVQQRSLTTINGKNRDGDLLTFPEGFLWGAATSHFQIEGLREEMSSRLSDWSLWMDEPGRIADGSNAERACQFVDHYPNDIELLQSLNLNSFRFSFNWPALLPDRIDRGENAKLQPEAVEYYKKMLADLKSRNIVNFATLFHFCLPTWLHDEGGWTSKESPRAFAEFSRLIAKEFGDSVDYWLTINEPMAYVYQSFVSGLWTPGGKNDYVGAFTAVKHMLEGHAMAYRAIKEELGDVPISFTNHWRPFHPERVIYPLDQAVCRLRDVVFNHLFPQSIKTGSYNLPGPLKVFPELRKIEGEIPDLLDTQDYMGVNYYTRELSKFKHALPIDPFGVSSSKPKLSTNALGWEVYPEGLYNILTRDLKPYRTDKHGREREVFITENGFAQSFDGGKTEGDWSLDDTERVEYLRLHLRELHRAIDAGVRVKGYLHWSLLDNFEWSEGLSPRFGLVRISYPTQERTPRKSARVYSDIARENGLRYSSKA